MKILASLVAASAMALSLLVAVPTTASAASAAYPGTVDTSCSYGVPGSARRNGQLTVAWRVTASGNARPSGIVAFVVYRATRGGLQFVKAAANGYTGPGLRTRSLGSFRKKGQYYTRMSFRPNRGSVFQGCGTGLRGFRVR